MLLLVAGAAGAAVARPGARCAATADCAHGELCLRDGRCRRVVGAPTQDPGHGSLPAQCMTAAWPNVTNCVQWSVNESGGLRVCESNDVPPYYVPPYCPFGAGQGYCQSPTVGNSSDCPPFGGLSCPCVPGNSTGAAFPPGPPPIGCPAGTPASGDVLVPVYQRFEIPLRADPTDPAKPKHMYDNEVLKTGNTYQVIGVHLNGVQLKGPAEANGFNVDTSLIPLACGGHVTPPVGPGPTYHYHKAADCVEIRKPGEHGPLIGWAADGFGIYGYGDVQGEPLVDECHGHFGTLPDGSVAYHYHASGVYNLPGKKHQPYYMGCQGPSKGKCNSTVSPDFDSGADWCGEGCGKEVCVQPGTNQTQLRAYLDGFPGGSAWLSQYTHNDF